MIRSFAGRATQRLFEQGDCPKAWRSFEERALSKLDMLHHAPSVDSLRIPPGNRLEKLRGDRDGAWSIRINDQFRLCFRWEGEHAFDVEIVDYH